jgi:hypothetical protein
LIVVARSTAVQSPNGVATLHLPFVYPRPPGRLGFVRGFWGKAKVTVVAVGLPQSDAITRSR